MLSKTKLQIRDLFLPVILVAAPGFVALCWLSVPFFQSSGGIALWHTGFAESLVRGGWFSYPKHIGYPDGAPIVFGASLSYFESAIISIFQVTGLDAYSIAGLFLSIVAFFGGYFLARELKCTRLLALLVSVAYCTQSFITIHIQGYGATGFGFALFPAFVAFYLKATMDSWMLNVPQAIFLFVCMTTICVFFSFLDGYSFVMMITIALSIAVAILFYGSIDRVVMICSFMLFCVSSLISYYLYKSYVGTDVLVHYPIDVFAILSVHIPSLIVPTAGYSPLFDALGVAAERPASAFSGAGLGNHETVYLTVSGLTAVVVSAFVRAHREIRLAAYLLVAGGLLMAIGPTLPTSGGPSDESNISTERLPIVKMPTYRLYVQVSGLDQMRATYRWVAVAKLGVWLLLICCCSYFQTKKWLVAPYLLVVIFMLECMAYPFGQIMAGQKLYIMATRLTDDLVTELKENIPLGSKVVVLPVTNDFVVHSVSANADIYLYNVGGDKNNIIAASQRPESISRIVASKGCLLEPIGRAAELGQLDYVAIRLFDSHRGHRGWVWPPIREEVLENTRVAQSLSAGIPYLMLKKGRYFWFVDANRVREYVKQTVPHANCLEVRDGPGL